MKACSLSQGSTTDETLLIGASSRDRLSINKGPRLQGGFFLSNRMQTVIIDRLLFCKNGVLGLKALMLRMEVVFQV